MQAKRSAGAELFELPSVCVHARYRVGERVDALYDGNGRLSPQGVRGEESARAVCASRKKPTSRAALLRAADAVLPALGLAAVDAVPVLAGHGPQAVALDVARLLARACAGRTLFR